MEWKYSEEEIFGVSENDIPTNTGCEEGIEPKDIPTSSLAEQVSCELVTYRDGNGYLVRTNIPVFLKA